MFKIMNFKGFDERLASQSQLESAAKVLDDYRSTGSKPEPSCGPVTPCEAEDGLRTH